jgi:hypothetical protein
MNSDTAEKLVDAANRIDKILNEMLLVADAIEDKENQKNILSGIFRTVHTLYYHVTREVCLEYPDLHPDFPEGGWPADPRNAAKS